MNENDQLFHDCSVPTLRELFLYNKERFNSFQELKVLPIKQMMSLNLCIVINSIGSSVLSKLYRTKITCLNLDFRRQIKFDKEAWEDFARVLGNFSMLRDFSLQMHRKISHTIFDALKGNH